MIHRIVQNGFEWLSQIDQCHTGATAFIHLSWEKAVIISKYQEIGAFFFQDRGNLGMSGRGGGVVEVGDGSIWGMEGYI